MLRSKILWRLLAISAVAALVILQPAVVGARAESGRDYSRCIISCNEVRRACEDVCRDWCHTMFPDDETLGAECISVCVGICIDDSKECKAACEALKPGYSPEEP